VNEKRKGKKLLNPVSNTDTELKCNKNVATIHDWQIQKMKIGTGVSFGNLDFGLRSATKSYDIERDSLGHSSKEVAPRGIGNKPISKNLYFRLHFSDAYSTKIRFCPQTRFRDPYQTQGNDPLVL
jgi:hypothetical protein